MSTKASKKMTPPQRPRFPIWLPLIIVAGVALIAVALSGGSAASAPVTKPQVSGAPALQIDQEKIDLGNVPLGQTVSAKFEVTNVGDQPLIFTAKPYVEVREGC